MSSLRLALKLSIEDSKIPENNNNNNNNSNNSNNNNNNNINNINNNKEKENDNKKLLKTPSNNKSQKRKRTPDSNNSDEGKLNKKLTLKHEEIDDNNSNHSGSNSNSNSHNNSHNNNHNNNNNNETESEIDEGTRNSNTDDDESVQNITTTTTTTIITTKIKSSDGKKKKNSTLDSKLNDQINEGNEIKYDINITNRQTPPIGIQTVSTNSGGKESKKREKDNNNNNNRDNNRDNNNVKDRPKTPTLSKTIKQEKNTITPTITPPISIPHSFSPINTPSVTDHDNNTTNNIQDNIETKDEIKIENSLSKDIEDDMSIVQNQNDNDNLIPINDNISIKTESVTNNMNNSSLLVNIKIEDINKEDKYKEKNNENILNDIKNEGQTFDTISLQRSDSMKSFDVGEEGDDEGIEKDQLNKDEKNSYQRKTGTKRKRRGGLDIAEADEILAAAAASSLSSAAATAQTPNINLNHGITDSLSVSTTDKLDDLDENNDNSRGPSRAAAMAAKSKINNTSVKGRQNTNELEIKKLEEVVSHHNNNTNTNHNHNENIKSTSVLKAQWVACDSCGKWRSLPGDVDLSSLPEQWFCSMNQWDPLHNDCIHAEEEYIEKDQEEDEQIPLIQPVRNEPVDVSNKRGRSVKSSGKLGNRRGRKPLTTKEYDNQINQTNLNNLNGDNSDDDNNNNNNSNNNNNNNQGNGNSDGYMGTRRRRGRGVSYAQSENESIDIAINQTTTSASSIVLPPNALFEKVNWVQCGKCSKWRKVPGKIHEEGLPDVWYCALNTWAPEYARCTAKEEEDDTITLPTGLANRVFVDSRSAGRGRYVRKTRTNDSSTAGIGRQWAQCERKNCKKWRKLPAHIDILTLPEKWYCEMNVWDPERATCDASEETDSESELPINGATRSQLILGNSKGPGTLSYRRLIFGTDGRIRPYYSEKNKNGYGLFSYTEVFRPNDGDEYVMPTRKVSYWWSSAYQDSSLQLSASLSSTTSTSNKSKKNEVLKQEPVNVFQDNYQSSLRPTQTHHLIDCIQRLSQPNLFPTSTFSSSSTTTTTTTTSLSSSSLISSPLYNKYSYDSTPPATKWNKILRESKKQTLFSRINCCCQILRSCLAVSSESLTLSEIYNKILKMYYHQHDLELCRSSLGLDEIKETLYRLEKLGEIEVTYNNNGLLSFRYLLQIIENNVKQNPFPDLLSSSDPDMQGRSQPLKMRKKKFTLFHALSSHNSNLNNENKNSSTSNSCHSKTANTSKNNKLSNNKGNKDKDNKNNKNNNNNNNNNNKSITNSTKKNLNTSNQSTLPLQKTNESTTPIKQNSNTNIQIVSNSNIEKDSQINNLSNSLCDNKVNDEIEQKDQNLDENQQTIKIEKQQISILDQYQDADQEVNQDNYIESEISLKCVDGGNTNHEVDSPEVVDEIENNVDDDMNMDVENDDDNDNEDEGDNDNECEINNNDNNNNNNYDDNDDDIYADAEEINGNKCENEDMYEQEEENDDDDDDENNDNNNNNEFSEEEDDDDDDEDGEENEENENEDEEEENENEERQEEEVDNDYLENYQTDNNVDNNENNENEDQEDQEFVEIEQEEEEDNNNKVNDEVNNENQEENGNEIEENNNQEIIDEVEKIERINENDNQNFVNDLDSNDQIDEGDKFEPN